MAGASICFTAAILCGWGKESAVAAVCFMTQQHRRKLTQQHRPNNYILQEAITHKSNKYNKWFWL